MSIPPKNKEELIRTGNLCPYCFGNTEHVPDSMVYSQGGFGGFVYWCRPCGAYVGCHTYRPKEAKGRLANAELRERKKEAHFYFDRLWQRKIATGASKQEARAKAYKWLAGEMRIDASDCHIGMMNVAQCIMVVQICKPYFK